MNQNINRQFPKYLLKWYDHEGRKNLPWQQCQTPYHVWISEIMLQQTQVSTVIPFFNRFIERFPNVNHLAASDIDDVLALWTGLGYYQRARNLHNGAKHIVNAFNGEFPNDPLQLMSIPGVGKTTANAIASLAFNQQAAILDGNVKRVLSRFYGVYGTPYEANVLKTLWHLAENTMPNQNCAKYSQAIMDLGAIICTRSKPSCHQCPVNKDCIAKKKGLQEVLPERRKKKTIPTKQSTFIIIENNKKQILLEQRPLRGLWGGLWILPQIAKADEKWLSDYQIESYQPFSRFRHTFSHFHLDVHVVSAKTKAEICQMKGKRRWYHQHQLANIGLPSPMIKTFNEYFC